jgi:hypothetical protein
LASAFGRGWSIQGLIVVNINQEGCYLALLLWDCYSRKVKNHQTGQVMLSLAMLDIER